jgi:hypothetical protein
VSETALSYRTTLSVPRAKGVLGLGVLSRIPAGVLPSAVPLGPLPSSCDPALAAQLQATGRVLYQEHDAVLTRLLDPSSSEREALHPAPRQVGE